LRQDGQPEWLQHLQDWLPADPDHDSQPVDNV